jgi:hypothetical protein
MQSEPIKTVIHNGKTIKIYQDETPETPRSWDNLAQMVFFGNKKYLGDKHEIKLGSFQGREDFIVEGARALAKQIKDIVVCLPVHMYSHSGERISTSDGYPFNCPWDSGTIGFVIVTKQAIRENWSIKKVTKKLIEQSKLQAEGEVETLNDYITGNIYGYQIVDENGNDLDSCWGFYGDIETSGIIEEAKGTIE